VTITGERALFRRLYRSALQVADFRYLGVAALIAACLLTLPVASYPMTPSGEFGYQAAMTVALREHLQWGSQVVWSYGPYGYLNEPAFMDFNSWLLAFATNLAGHFALFGVFALFLFRIKARPWQWLLVSVVIVLCFDRYAGHEFERFAVLDHKAALVAVLLLYLAAETSSRQLAALMAGGAGLVIGYLFLDKGTFLLVGGTLVAAYFTLSLTRSRAGSFAALLGGLVVGYLALWLLAGQSISGIPSYFRTFYEEIAGYTPAMSWFDESGAAYPTLQWGLSIAMLATTGLSLLITLWRREWSLFRLLLLTTPLMFFVFKNSFVRFDEGHAVTFWALVGVLQGLVLVRAIAATSEIKPRAPAVLAGLTMLASVVLVGGLGPFIGGFPDMRPTLAFPDNLVSYRHAVSLLVRPYRRQEEEAQVRSSLQAAYPLPPDVVNELRHGTVDAVPLDIQQVFAYDLHWDPQPVFLSYNAYRPYLDHLDAQHYMGPQAPQYVLFVAEDIDLRYPLFDEPETYRVLMERYQVLQRISNLLILERRPDAPPPPERQAGNVAGRFGDWINVPPHGDQRLYGRVQVGYTLLGQALYLLDRPPELQIRFKYGGGQISPAYRFIPATAPDGLDLSAYAPDTASVERLAEGQFDQPIEAIQIRSDSPAAAYKQDIQVAYFTQPVT
jgi:hypothetical protein